MSIARMGRALSVFVLLCLAGALGAQAPQERAQSQQAKPQQEQPKSAPSVSANSKAVNAVQPPEYYRPCGNDRQNGNSDLCAQWVSAKGAADAAYWAGWSFWLSLLAFFGLAGTLYYTRKAVLAAEEGTRDADRAIEIADRNASAALRAAEHTAQSVDVAREAGRAWVVCDDVVLLEPVKYSVHPQLGPRYDIGSDIVLRNTGQGLARRTFVHTRMVSMECAVFDPALAGLKAAAEAVFDTHYSSDPYRGLPIAPGQVVRLRHGWGGPVPEHPTMAQIKAGSFFILGYVAYLDHFGRSQSSIFAFHPDSSSVSPWDGITMVRSSVIGDAT